ncbi:MAG: hypothetical protein HYT78_19820 [Deltaproteobacteria bacterium]|nr:hypothetical protein [Deltaproteobacteria bacterium]
MKRLDTGILIASCLMAVLLSGCRKDLGTAQGVAEEFVDQHYVHIDLEKAKPYTVGLALEKINEDPSLANPGTKRRRSVAGLELQRVRLSRIFRKREGNSGAGRLGDHRAHLRLLARGPNT